MKNPIRMAAALAGLALAVPALPCGLMQHTTAGGKDQQPVVAQAPKDVEKTRPPTTVKKAPKAAAKTPTVAKN